MSLWALGICDYLLTFYKPNTAIKLEKILCTINGNGNNHWLQRYCGCRFECSFLLDAELFLASESDPD